MKLHISVLALALLSFLDPVGAADGPCGIKVGQWVTPSCLSPSDSEFSTIEIGRRTWTIYESTCALRSPKLSGKTCEFRLLCEAEGEAHVEQASFEKVDEETIHVSNLIFRHCGR